MSALLYRAILPAMRWRVMRTFTPVLQAPAARSFCPIRAGTGGTCALRQIPAYPEISGVSTFGVTEIGIFSPSTATGFGFVFVDFQRLRQTARV